MVNSPSPSWCNCHLDTQPRHCRVCAPERKPTRKRAVVPRRLKRREIAKQLKDVEVGG